MKKIDIIDGLSDRSTGKLPLHVKLLGEDDFLPAMEGDAAAWREEKVKEGYLTATDGVRLHYYYSIPEKCRGTIVIVHGFCEFWGKYHEMAWYYDKAGYAVFFLEQRGHGYSEGKMEEADMVHSDGYDAYVEDLKLFMDQCVVRKAVGKLCLYAHSMGGAVAALFLEKYPRYFRSAILSSPMLKVKTGDVPGWKMAAIEAYIKIKEKQRELAPGQKRFSPTPVFETSSTLSRPRYDYVFEQRLEDWHYQTYGATCGWALASRDADRVLLSKANRVRIPVLIFQAGQDHLVDPEGQVLFAKKAGNARIVRYDQSRHEIFNALPEVRENYYSRIFDFLEKRL